MVFPYNSKNHRDGTNNGEPAKTSGIPGKQEIKAPPQALDDSGSIPPSEALQKSEIVPPSEPLQKTTDSLLARIAVKIRRFPTWVMNIVSPQKPRHNGSDDMESAKVAASNAARAVQHNIDQRLNDDKPFKPRLNFPASPILPNYHPSR